MSRKARTARGGARGRSRRTKILINSFLVGALALTAGGTWWFLHPSAAQANVSQGDDELRHDGLEERRRRRLGARRG